MNSHDIKAFARTQHLDAVGIVPAHIPLPPPEYFSSPLCPLAAGHGNERYLPARLLPSCRSVIVIIFPYFTGLSEKSNLSMYCRSLDYHTIVSGYLHGIEKWLHDLVPDCETLSIIDTSPLDDRWLAYQAGLGFFGDNHCFINETYGSYCFIGSILTSLELTPDVPHANECRHCGRCAAGCPGQCFHNGSYHYETCKSFLTQKKGGLTPPEIAVIQKTPLVFGCDECQRVCPHNQAVSPTPLPEFYADRLLMLHGEEFAGLSNRQFQQAYSTRAFAWRGKRILLRNCGYLQSLKPGEQGDYGNGDVNKKQDDAPSHNNNRQNNG